MYSFFFRTMLFFATCGALCFFEIFFERVCDQNVGLQGSEPKACVPCTGMAEFAQQSGRRHAARVRVLYAVVVCLAVDAAHQQAVPRRHAPPEHGVARVYGPPAFPRRARARSAGDGPAARPHPKLA